MPQKTNMVDIVYDADAMNTKQVPVESLSHELSALLNRRSLENDSDTPDYILAQFMIDCLAAFNGAVNGIRASFPWHPFQLRKPLRSPMPPRAMPRSTVQEY